MTLAPHGPSPALAETERLVARWLHREARLLDEQRYEDWLDLLAPDVHYWVPGIENRYRHDPDGTHGPGRMAFFDDDLASLRRRVARLTEPSAWAEDPATRHLHVVANIEVDPGEGADELLVRSVVTCVRGRGRRAAEVLHGRRRDVLRWVDGRLLLARRVVLLADSVLDANNLNTFL